MDLLLNRETNDIEIINGKPAIDDSLETSIFISLFTDSRALDDDIPPDGSTNRRGFWGDGLETDPLGSRLWLLSRSKINADLLGKIETYSLEALQWLIDDGVCSEITVNVEINAMDKERIDFEIILVKPDIITQTFSYFLNWVAQEAKFAV